MKKGIFLLAVLFPLLSLDLNKLSAQETDVYSLLTERYVDRPINVHRGQLTINSGYDFSIIKKNFDQDGKWDNLAKDGTAAATHLVPFNIKFGILEHIQFSSAINYSRTGIREREEWIQGWESALSINELNEIKGFDDLYLGLDVRIPFDFKNIDWTIFSGLYLPISNHKPDQPVHKIEHYQTDLYITNINLHFINKRSKGIMVGSIGSAFKIHLSKFCVIANGAFSLGLQEGESILWHSSLIEDEFEYYSTDYQFKIGNEIYYNSILAWQALDWFAVTLSFSGNNIFGGWNNETGKKIKYDEQSIFTSGMGYEIQVSPHLRLFQNMELPIVGKNIQGLFIIQTGVIINYISQYYYNIF